MDTAEEILTELKRLPPDKHLEVLDFVHFLKTQCAPRIVPEQSRNRLKRRRLADLPAYGLWKDRTDISDTVAFSMKLRHRIEERRDGSLL